MIGVIVESTDNEVVREFFELFKTPWEFYRKDYLYDVVLCGGGIQFAGNAKLTLVYAGHRTDSDHEQKIETGGLRRDPCILSSRTGRLPIYGTSVTFEGRSGPLTDENSGECLAFLNQSDEAVTVRIGYDLFDEIRTLLTVGQPPCNAAMPALELHIAFLRDLITECGVQLVEVPPVPEGYRFIACLTHDVDHPSIRLHRWDHTVLGFAYRGIWGSTQNFMRGRLSVRQLFTNWLAVLKLPFVQVGLAKDFWLEFADRYLKLENGALSTFFVIPFSGRPGRGANGPAPAFRASRYGARDIARSMQKLLTAGCEVGLHGIDAWVDSTRGREELDEIKGLTKGSETGVRMHWLYYDQQSPKNLENAGASYDSTVGYNETVGYRAGTTQVYKPLNASRLLELPLHVMDTALFYNAYLGLSPKQAQTLIDKMIDNVAQFGGCITLNWHDRSVSPERLWGASYLDLIRDLKSRGAWFATGAQAVAWFRRRRSLVFEGDTTAADALDIKARTDRFDRLPELQLRTHQARGDMNEPSNSTVPCAVSY